MQLAGANLSEADLSDTLLADTHPTANLTEGLDAEFSESSDPKDNPKNDMQTSVDRDDPQPDGKGNRPQPDYRM